MAIEMDTSVNVLGGKLESCSTTPMTGFFRDGHCNTCAADQGSHTVCLQIPTVPPPSWVTLDKLSK